MSKPSKRVMEAPDEGQAFKKLHRTTAIKRAQVEEERAAISELLQPQSKIVVDLPGVKENHLPLTAIQKLVPILCPNDTQGVKWWEGGSDFQSVQDVARVTPMYCDNFLFYTVFDESKLEKKGQQRIFSEVGVFNKILQVALRERGIMEKIRIEARHMRELDIDEEKDLGLVEAVQRYQKKYPDRPKGTYYKQSYKIACANAPLDQVLGFLQARASKLQEQHLLYFQDLDLTTDYACTPTDRILEHIEKLGIEILPKKKAGEYLKAYFCAEPTDKSQLYFVQNDSEVGENCWTFLMARDGICIRFKIYNKFCCLMESPGVLEVFGSHILDIMHNPRDPQLQQTFRDPRVQKCGVSRIECTFYRRIPERERS